MKRAGPRKGAATPQAALGGQGSADLGPLSGDERFRAGATRHAAESLPPTGGQGPGSPPAVVSAQEHGVHGAPRSQVSVSPAVQTSASGLEEVGAVQRKLTDFEKVRVPSRCSESTDSEAPKWSPRIWAPLLGRVPLESCLSIPSLSFPICKVGTDTPHPCPSAPHCCVRYE